jgi:SAM-dependent methyltransferase
MTPAVAPAFRAALPPAAAAFDAVAERFDARYGAWLSVAAQRRAVRAALAEAFPLWSRVLEIGGGTGEDACWLTERGRDVLLTDPSPAMVRLASEKLRAARERRDSRDGASDVIDAEGVAAVGCAAEDLETLVASPAVQRRLPFDGAFSNFAGLNCVSDLAPVGRALGQLVRPGGRVLLVLFGACSPGEWVVQLARGDWRGAARRFSTGDVHARLGGRDFTVRYHRARDIRRALHPWFTLRRRLGIGLFVPPSAAEPAISRHPRALAWLERADRIVSRPLAALGDHVLYDFIRTRAS